MISSAMILPALGLTMVLTACGGTGSMMETVDRQGFGQSMDDLRAEEAVHHANVTSAGSLADVQAEIARHREAIAVMEMDVRVRIGHMTAGCGPTGREGMLGVMGGLDALEAAHGAAMAGSGSLDVARAECDRHAAASGPMLDRLEADWDDMDCM